MCRWRERYVRRIDKLMVQLHYNFETGHVFDFNHCIQFVLLGKDTCQGDSGGPLMVRQGKEGLMYLKGILSFGSSKCGKKYPAVFTRVTEYIPWLKKHMYR